MKQWIGKNTGIISSTAVDIISTHVYSYSSFFQWSGPCFMILPMLHPEKQSWYHTVHFLCLSSSLSCSLYCWPGQFSLCSQRTGVCDSTLISIVKWLRQWGSEWVSISQAAWTSSSLQHQLWIDHVMRLCLQNGCVFSHPLISYRAKQISSWCRVDMEDGYSHLLIATCWEGSHAVFRIILQIM